MTPLKSRLDQAAATLDESLFTAAFNHPGVSGQGLPQAISRPIIRACMEKLLREAANEVCDDGDVTHTHHELAHCRGKRILSHFGLEETGR